MEYCLSQLVIIKYQRLDGLNRGNNFCIILEPGSLKSGCQHIGSGESPLLGLQIVAFLLYPHIVERESKLSGMDRTFKEIKTAANYCGSLVSSSNKAICLFLLVFFLRTARCLVSLIRVQSHQKGFTLVNSSNPNYLPRPHILILSHWGLGL